VVILEAEITPGMTAAEVVELAVAVERAGFDRLGVSDVVLWPDCYVLLGLVAEATERIALGSMVTNPYSRHPVVHAGALATLQDVSGGRAFFGLGVGAGLEVAGMDYPRPVQTLRETVAVVRALLGGGEAVHDGEVLRLAPSRLVGPAPTPVPVAIGTRSPGVMRLAGEIADVALVGARYLRPETVATYRGWLAEGAARAGRDPAEVEVAPRVTLCVSEDSAAAVASVKRYAAHYLDLLGEHGPTVEAGRRAEVRAALDRSSGWYFDHDRFDDPALDDLIDGDLARAFAIVGDPAECLDQLRETLALGFTSVSCNLAAVRRPGNSMAEGLAETIAGAATVVSHLRRAA
jgi:5,10-methylenetetrahydromethanopterin reductase